MIKTAQISLNELLSLSVQLVSESIKIIYDVHNSKDLKQTWKGKNDPLTIADIKSQTLIIQGLSYHFPQIKYVGEEDEVFPDPLHVDFSKQLRKILPNDIFPEDLQLNSEELTAFIDPLDGTLCYVNGDLNYVTVLLGFAYKKRPIVGLIGQIWSLNHEGKIIYDPKIYFGYNALGRVFSLNVLMLKTLESNPSIIPEELIKPLPKDLSKDFVVVFSKNKNNEILEANIQKLNPTKAYKAGATGYKFMEVVKGLADCYFYEIENNGTKRWDTCAGEALLSCFGGITTGKDGVAYDYVYGMDPQNLKGVLSVIDKKKHEEVVKITEKMPYDFNAMKI